MTRHLPNIRPWVICTVARSGSEWLCDLVKSTNVLGAPMEYLLNPRDWFSKFGLPNDLPLDEYLGFLMEHTSTPNGIFGIKGSLAELRPFFDCFGDVPCVWLHREQRLEQAISWYRATASGVWHVRAGHRSQVAPPFDRTEIIRFLEIIQEREREWTNWFSDQGILPLEVVYEQACLDPLATVRAIAEHVGVSSNGIDHIESTNQVIRDNVTASWLQSLGGMTHE